MKGRRRVAGASGGGAPTDLLSCFPSSVHLALMPKPIYSPSRSTDLTKHRPTQPTNRGHSSPLFRSNASNHSAGSATADIEPTSPKVTCAGQIKVHPRSSSGRKPATSSAGFNKGWLSVMEEMERIHRKGKKPLTHFLCAVRGILQFDLRCFGSFRGTVDCSTDEERADEEEENGEKEDKDLDDYESKTIFSNWFMVLENQGRGLMEEEIVKETDAMDKKVDEVVPPHNALLLMRCRSAPAKGRERVVDELEEKEVNEKEKMKDVDRFLMSYAPNFINFSTEIAKETWVVGKFDPLARSRSWKR